ncbi:PH domain-containing protein [Brachybacterium sp. Z12]|uniref:PH domain-containing protein n=1 Tax=Brachybacterium sp. Z12 TaxID=2759167 RepID=UPI00223C3B27|nr:PH domain-containing protein [Brachybacterium sp. Z12]
MPPTTAEQPTATVPDPSTPRRRTHPITPLVTGWKLVVGVIAVIAAQNIAQLLNEFTLQRALIGAGLLLAAAIIAIVFSTLSWWFTTYAVDEDGVSLHSGMISRSREYAPRARIESVSVERPLLARLLGLAKVRVEVAGGGESYLDIEYVKSAAAEDLRRGSSASPSSPPRTLRASRPRTPPPRRCLPRSPVTRAHRTRTPPVPPPGGSSSSSPTGSPTAN